MTARPLPELLTAAEVSALMKCGKSWPYDNAKALGGRKYGGLLRFPADRVLAYLEGDQRPTPITRARAEKPRPGEHPIYAFIEQRRAAR